MSFMASTGLVDSKSFTSATDLSSTDKELDETTQNDRVKTFNFLMSKMNKRPSVSLYNSSILS